MGTIGDGQTSAYLELIDTSVWAQRNHTRVRDWFLAAALAGQIAVCDAIVLELLRFQPPATFSEAAGHLSRITRPMGREEWVRAREVLALLVQPGRQTHSRVNPSDLLIAASAERHGLTLVHYDEHFDLIAGVTGQPTRWVAPRGSLS